MAAPVIRVSAPGVARVVSVGGALRVVDPNPDQPWPGRRTPIVDEDGERSVRDSGGRRVTQITARAGELTSAVLTLQENGVDVTDDLTAAACQWVASKYGETDLTGDVTGAPAGVVTLSLDLAADVLPGWWELWVQVDGVSWPTERNNSALRLKIEKDV